MDKKEEELKFENSMSNSTFSDEINQSNTNSYVGLSSIFDMTTCDQQGGGGGGDQKGFMEMLEIHDQELQDYGQSLLDWFQTPSSTTTTNTTMPVSMSMSMPPQQQPQEQPLPAESSEVLNTPATPNSSSISSSSNEAVNNEEQIKAGHEEDPDQEKTKKQ
jgi:hypothetical protein